MYTYIRENFNTTNYGSNSKILIGKDDSGKVLKGLIEFGLSSIPANSTIVSAKLQVNLSYSSNNNNITIKVSDEAGPALATQVTVYYNALGTWLIPSESNDYTLLDYGNGTYRAAFSIVAPTPDVEVSVHTTDFRGIYVLANTTSTEV
jgi:hypothetical protein